MEAQIGIPFGNEIKPDNCTMTLYLTKEDVETFKKAAEEIKLTHCSDSGIRVEFSPLLDAIITEAEK